MNLSPTEYQKISSYSRQWSYRGIGAYEIVCDADSNRIPYAVRRSWVHGMVVRLEFEFFYLYALSTNFSWSFGYFY